jgi:hypothetical protein
MPFTTAEHFARQHGGFDSLMKFAEMINAGDNLDSIAEYFHLSTSHGIVP